ncbi:MAG: heparinase II/III family protein [Caldilineaceae bacterium]
MFIHDELDTLEQLLHAHAWHHPFPACTDRAAWARVAERLGPTAVATRLTVAAAEARQPIPPLPASLWLDFARSGRRELYEEPASQRRRMLWTLTFAECLEDQGRFLDPLLDLAWAICEESSWCYPAHQAELTDIGRQYLDLGVAGTALMLAELDALIGSKLDPGLGKRIRDEIDRRCLTPYLTRDDHWWLFQGKERNAVNWTAVCNSGIVGAAIYLEENPKRLAAIIARAIRSLDDYVDSFDPDGGTSEGPGYWGYGFGNYVILADLLLQRTGGQVDLLAGERLRKIATFPLRTLLSHSIYVNFSDCDPDVALEPALLHYLGNRLALPDLHGLARVQPDSAPHRAYFDWGLRHLFWQPPVAAPTTYAPARHDWFRGVQWFFARVNPADPNALVLAAKGGHNNEMHNQNDVGNYIVHWRGESLIADVGRGKYTKEYFGEQRYDYFVNSSLGHSVPVVNGLAQGTGAAFAANVLDERASETEDTLLLDLTHVYPAAAGLQSLQRRLTLHREAPHGWVIVEDLFTFAAEPAAFASALTTFNQVTIGENGVLIKGIHGAIRIGFDPAVVEPRLEEHAVEFEHGVMVVARVVFVVREMVQTGVVRLEIVPV